MEVEVIDLFVSAVRLAGVPKSIGEIYGLLFISPDPLPLDALVRRLRISKGSASQGLRFLKAVGAVKPVYVAGDRRDHFEAVLELKQLAAGFIREELQPHLENGTRRLERLAALAAEEVDDPPERTIFVDQRVQKLKLWHRRAVEALPLIKGMLGR